MKVFARPGIVAAALVGAALLVHPAGRAGARLPWGAELVAGACLLALLVLLARSLEARPGSRLGPALLAAGAALVVSAVGYDGIRGFAGSLALVPGQARGDFEEQGPGGRPLGLRPLGFGVGLEGVSAGGEASLMLPGRSAPTEVTPDRAVGFGGFRIARPRLAPTGEAERLTIGISGEGGQTSVDLVPGQPATSGDLVFSLEAYFPDFALDERQQPYSRSRESRNPAALLTVSRGDRAYRVFVLGAMPGVHRVEELGRSFSMLDAVPQMAASLDVHREPAAAIALLGVALALAGLAWERWPR